MAEEKTTKLEGALRNWAKTMLKKEGCRGEFMRSPLGRIYVEVPLKFNVDLDNPSIQMVFTRKDGSSIKMTKLEYFPGKDEIFMVDISTITERDRYKSEFHQSVYDIVNERLSLGQI